MLIKSKIKRKEGTLVKLEGKEYRFAPNDQGDHVCEVKDKKHCSHLLAIKEGFEIYDDEESNGDEKEEIEQLAAAKLKNANENGTPVTNIDNDEKAMTESVINDVLDQLESDDDADDDEADEAEADEAEADEAEADASEHDEAWYREQYSELMGKKPHHNMKIETIREEVDKILNPSDRD